MGSQTARRLPLRLTTARGYMEVDYYKQNGIEAIDVIEAFDLDFSLGNVIKYVLRAGRKTNKPLHDLVKARDYLEREIERLIDKSLIEQQNEA